MSVKIQWITWWPAPYWEPRFEMLNSYDDIELKVYYIQKFSPMHKWPKNENRKYSHEFINEDLNNEIGYKFVGTNIHSLFRSLKVLNHNFDFVILPYADIRYLLIILLCIIKKRKYLLFCVNTINDKRRNSFYKKFIKTILFNKASLILATGISQKEYGQKFLKSGEKIKVIGNPSVSFEKALERTQRNKTSSRSKNTLILLFVGRLSKEKGIYDLLRSASLLKDSKIKLKIVIVGDGPEREQLKKFSDKIKVKCIFKGFIKEINRLNEIYKNADIFVLPSFSESWGLVVNEAMQNKLPIILSDKVGCKKMLLKEGINGYSYRGGDIQDLSQKIKLLFNHNKREHMGQQSYKIIQNQNPKNWAEKVVKAICDII